MATIHAFKPVSRSVSPALVGAAEIIIFPGVRYEYGCDTRAEAGRAKPATRKGAQRKTRSRRRNRAVKRDYLDISA
jgi:hypothetical protein